MKSTHHDTALLIFALSSNGSGKWNDINSGDDHQNLCDFLNARILQVAEKSGLPYYLIDEKDQIGDTFGERISNAYQMVFDKGYQNVIGVGNDCLALQPSDIIRAAHQLSDGKPTVLGQDVHGGAYLIGLNNQIFSYEQFCFLRWQSSYAFEDLLNLSTEVYLMEQKVDFNTSHDLKSLIREHLSKSLKALITQLLNRWNTIQYHVVESFSENLLYSFRLLRAPPITTA